MLRANSPKRSTARSQAPTYSRHQQISLVPPKSPLVKRGQGPGNGLKSSRNLEEGFSAMSTSQDEGMTLADKSAFSEGSFGSRSSVRRPRIFGDTSRLLDEKPKEVPRDLIQKAFYVWDTDKDAFVDLKDLLEFVRKASLRLNHTVLEHMFDDAIKSFNGGHTPQPPPFSSQVGPHHHHDASSSPYSTSPVSPSADILVVERPQSSGSQGTPQETAMHRPTDARASSATQRPQPVVAAAAAAATPSGGGRLRRLTVGHVVHALSFRRVQVEVHRSDGAGGGSAGSSSSDGAASASGPHEHEQEQEPLPGQQGGLGFTQTQWQTTAASPPTQQRQRQQQAQAQALGGRGGDASPDRSPSPVSSGGNSRGCGGAAASSSSPASWAGTGASGGMGAAAAAEALSPKTHGKVRRREWRAGPFYRQWLALVEASLPNERVLAAPSTKLFDKPILTYRERTGMGPNGLPKGSGSRGGSGGSVASGSASANSPFVNPWASQQQQQYEQQHFQETAENLTLRSGYASEGLTLPSGLVGSPPSGDSRRGGGGGRSAQKRPQTSPGGAGGAAKLALSQAILHRRPRSRAHGALPNPNDPADFHGTRGMATGIVEAAAGRAVAGMSAQHGGGAGHAMTTKSATSGGGGGGVGGGGSSEGGEGGGAHVVLAYLKETEKEIEALKARRQAAQEAEGAEGAPRKEGQPGGLDDDQSTSPASAVPFSPFAKQQQQRQQRQERLQQQLKQQQRAGNSSPTGLSSFQRLTSASVAFELVSDDGDSVGASDDQSPPSPLSPHTQQGFGASQQEGVAVGKMGFAVLSDMNALAEHLEASSEFASRSAQLSRQLHQDRSHLQRPSTSSSSSRRVLQPNSPLSSTSLLPLSPSSSASAAASSSSAFPSPAHSLASPARSVVSAAGPATFGGTAGQSFATADHSTRPMSSPMGSGGLLRFAGSPAMIDATTRSQSRPGSPQGLDGMWAYDGGGRELVAGDKDGVHLTSSGPSFKEGMDGLSAVSSKGGHDGDWQRTFFQKSTSEEWRRSVVRVVREHNEDVRGYANNQIDAYERRLRQEDLASKADPSLSGRQAFVTPARTESTLELKNKVGADQHGLMGLPVMGVFDKNVPKPYVHSFRADNEVDVKQRQARTLQLAPNRLHGQLLEKAKIQEAAAAEVLQQQQAEAAAAAASGASAYVTKANLERAAAGAEALAKLEAEKAKKEEAAAAAAGDVWGGQRRQFSASLVPENSRTSQRANLPHSRSVPSFKEMQLKQVVKHGDGFNWVRLNQEGGHKMRVTSQRSVELDPTKTVQGFGTLGHEKF